MKDKRIDTPKESADSSEREYHKNNKLIALSYSDHILEKSGVSVGVFFPYAALAASVIYVQEVYKEDREGNRAA